MPQRCLSLGWLVALLAACGGGDEEPDAGPPPADAYVDYSGPLFEADHLVQVSIEMAPADWDTLRRQTRSVTSLFSNCGMSQFEDPFTYFPGTVTVDGTRLDEVGVRKKGFLGSLDTERPSIKLKFNEYVSGQRLLGLNSFTLNNAKQDPSLMRTCLAYRTFTAAGVPAPRCNFARVRVNGDDLGVYVHVEALNKDFLRRTHADPEGNLYEGTLSDFRDGWTATFELKTNESANDRTDLDPVVAALERSDGELLGAIDPLVDLEKFYTFWATEALVTHWDGYTGNQNNFFAYHDPATGKFEFMPWGADATFMSGTSPFGLDGGAVQAVGFLSRRLYLMPETRDRYIARLRSLLASAWNETDLLAEIDRIEDLIGPIAEPSGSGPFTTEVEAVRTFVRDRRAAIEGDLAGGPPPWTQALRDPPCFETIGNLTGTFSTTWGTTGAANPFMTGTGTLTGTLEGTPITGNPVGATSGYDAQAPAPPPAQVAVIGVLPDNTAEILVFQIQPELIAPGVDLPIDWTGVFGAVYNLDLATGAFVLVGLFSDGTVHLTQASKTNGAAVTGSYTGTVIRSPF